MTISPRNEATALLTLHLGKTDERTVKPLSPREWTQLARWLAERNHTPEDLLSIVVPEILTNWHDRKIPAERIIFLLNRGYALSLKLTDWLDGNGLRLIGRSDSEYPKRLRQRLGENSPPLLFVAGRSELLRNEGLAIVGSRHATEDDLARARAYGVEASVQGLNVVSGGAKGIDSAAVDGALDVGGTAVAVLGNSLLQAARLPATRLHIHQGSLLLLTPFAPDAPFSVGNAMARNKLIYGLSEAAVVVASESGSGGTFAGAVEALKARWIPVGLVPSSDPTSGFSELEKQGGIALTTNPSEDFAHLLSSPWRSATQSAGMTGPIPAQAPLIPATSAPTLNNGKGLPHESAAFSEVSRDSKSLTDAQTHSLPLVAEAPDTTISSVPLPGMIEEFVRYWKSTQPCPFTAQALADDLHLQKSQVQAWLKELVETGRVTKKKDPVRYILLD